jgi:hypothetical protein
MINSVRNDIAHAGSLWDVHEQVAGIARGDWHGAMFRAPNEQAVERWRTLVRSEARAYGLRIRTGMADTDPLLCWAFRAPAAEGTIPQAP